MKKKELGVKSLFVVGSMSGTSADGADFAGMQIQLDLRRRRVLKERLLSTAKFEMPKGLRMRILQAQTGKIDLIRFGALQRDYSLWVSHGFRAFLQRSAFPAERTLLSCHGQTLWHAPPLRRSGQPIGLPGWTLQMLDPSLLSQHLGMTCAYGFRQPDMALHGEGAPLVPYYHFLKVTDRSVKGKAPLLIHNLGGISNLTFIPKDQAGIVAFDTGPANALIDLAAIRVSRGKKQFDESGQMARQGEIDWDGLEALLRQEVYFSKSPPKSTGKELFGEEYFRKHFAKRYSGNDMVANATAFTALSIGHAYHTHLLSRGHHFEEVYFCGGGAKNPYLLSLIQRVLEDKAGRRVPFRTLSEVEMPAAFLEAMAFARFGVEALLARPIALPNVTGAFYPAIGASLSIGANFPDLVKGLRPYKE